MDAQKQGIIRLRRLSREDVANLKSDRQKIVEAQQQAEEILSEARAEAARLRAQAQREVQAEQERLKARASIMLEQVLDRHRLTEGARAVAATILVSHRIQHEFDQMSPWLSDLVMEVVQKIIGALPSETVWQGVLAAALNRTRQHWDLQLLCHPDAITDITRALDALGPMADSITDIQPEPSMEPGTCYVMRPDGIEDITITVQIEELRKALAEAVQEQGASLGVERQIP